MIVGTDLDLLLKVIFCFLFLTCCIITSALEGWDK